MRIIKQGIKPEELWYRGECRYCGTVVEVRKNETQSSSQYNEWYRWVMCPVCRASITVTEMDATAQEARTLKSGV